MALSPLDTLTHPIFRTTLRSGYHHQKWYSKSEHEEGTTIRWEQTRTLLCQLLLFYSLDLVSQWGPREAPLKDLRQWLLTSQPKLFPTVLVVYWLNISPASYRPHVTDRKTIGVTSLAHGYKSSKKVDLNPSGLAPEPVILASTWHCLSSTATNILIVTACIHGVYLIC